MGGDEGVNLVIPGAAKALIRRPDFRFRLYGDQKVVEPVLARYPRVAEVSVFEHFRISLCGWRRSRARRSAMVAAARSMWRAIEAVKKGEADFAVSAGNTGALMAMARFCLRTTADIDRPAIAALWPTIRGESVVLDCGATIGADAQQLFDFAVMGGAMARALFDIPRPTVGLLNIGVEEVKGLEPVREAGQLLREANLPNIDYYGFVEGDDIGKGTVDVVVTEGFSGNIALKTAEGTAKQIAEYLRSAMNRTFLARIGYFLARDAFERLREKMDPRRGNGGVFLGLNGHRHQEPRRHRPGGLRHGRRTRIQHGAQPASRKDQSGRDRVLQRAHRPGGTPKRAGGGAVSTIRSVVLGAGGYLPEKVLSNDELSQLVETSDEWIRQRTGIRERHIAADGEFTSDLALHAAKAALDNAGLTPADIDLIVLATATPDHTFPAAAVSVQKKLGMKHGVAFDIQAVCSGFLFALTTADAMIKSGQAKRALVIGAETFSRILDWTDRSTCVLFGDGAGAVVLSAESQPGWRSDRGRALGASPLGRAATRRCSMSTAARRRPAPSAISAWRAARSSNTPSAWSPT